MIAQKLRKKFSVEVKQLNKKYKKMPSQVYNSHNSTTVVTNEFNKFI